MNQNEFVKALETGLKTVANNESRYLGKNSQGLHVYYIFGKGHFFAEEGIIPYIDLDKNKPEWEKVLRNNS